jgi:hypothetical protein
LPDGIVELQSFQDEPSAWIARALLEANGIRSEVITDPPYAHPWPRVRLALRAEDVDAAVQLLRSGPDGPSA